MKTALKIVTLAGAGLALILQHAAADILIGTTGSGNMLSTLVEINQDNGQLIRVIGPVGYKVNGLAWDRSTATLYATTSVKDTRFHGLITINPLTGEGAPVDPSVVNFGLGDDETSPVLGITMDSRGRLVGWYRELGDPSDTFVVIDKLAGTATEFPDTGIAGARVGLSFNGRDELWLIDSPAGGAVQLAYLLDSLTGVPIESRLLSPPVAAALGDFSPGNNRYYGINKDPQGGTPQIADLVTVNVQTGKVKIVGRTVDNLHVITFVKPPLPQ
jgi:hypothetical protein